MFAWRRWRAVSTYTSLLARNMSLNGNSPMLESLNRQYRDHVLRLTATHPIREAMELAVGGEFEAIGQAELEILQAHGLATGDYLIDVGCGSGRLAAALAGHGSVSKYLGIDVVPELVDFARDTVSRPGWTFECTDGAEIPEQSSSADWVAMFSVLTHLPHELAFRYLQECRRVLRPKGHVVFSFLEFGDPAHWPVFDGMVASVGEPHHHNQFLERSVIRLWADVLGMSIVAIRRGDSYVQSGAFAQSVCVMRNVAPRSVPRRLRTLWRRGRALPQMGIRSIIRTAQPPTNQGP